MQEIPLTAEPNQEFTVRLDGYRYVLRIKEARGVMVVDVTIDDVLVLSASRVVAGYPLIPYTYLSAGNFVLLSVDDELPDWRLFGFTQSLIYAGPDEL